jgi:hypothetical protein
VEVATLASCRSACALSSFVAPFTISPRCLLTAPTVRPVSLALQWESSSSCAVGAHPGSWLCSRGRDDGIRSDVCKCFACIRRDAHRFHDKAEVSCVFGAVGLPIGCACSSFVGLFVQAKRCAKHCGQLVLSEQQSSRSVSSVGVAHDDHLLQAIVAAVAVELRQQTMVTMMGTVIWVFRPSCSTSGNSSL